jgi:hypothetical protein
MFWAARCNAERLSLFLALGRLSASRIRPQKYDKPLLPVRVSQRKWLGEQRPAVLPTQGQSVALAYYDPPGQASLNDTFGQVGRRADNVVPLAILSPLQMRRDTPPTELEFAASGG